MTNVPAALRPLQQQFVAARNERIAEIRRLAEQALTDTTALDQLRMAFHKLAGSAGLLGFPKSGVIARETEHLISDSHQIPPKLSEAIDQFTQMIEEEVSALDQQLS
ncbi:MAG: Hpt domain-containing protein, partial [Planctomycetota bacterium]